jgi:hypothetical protein
MFTVILTVVLLFILVIPMGYIAERKLARSDKTLFLSVAVVLTVIRVGSLWFLQFREWTNTQSLSYLPLVFLLFPEALLEEYLVPQVPAPARSVWDVLLFSELLAFGSVFFAYLLAFGCFRNIKRLKSQTKM